MGVQLSPLVCRHLRSSLVSVKSRMPYTKCTIEEGGSSIHVQFKISYTAICTVRTAELNN